LGLSKQSVHQLLKRKERSFEKTHQFIEKAEAIRRTHPEMGCRKIALKLRETGYGRDKLEGILMGSGFRVIYPPNYSKTTHSVRIHRFRNLIEGLVINRINQVVQTDITYFWMSGSFGYLVFIIDVYSRLIVGYHASEGLESSANMRALKMMIQLRGEKNLKGLIHHSDKGSQYHSTEYLKTLSDHKIEVSMCDYAWQNAYTERINRTLKNEYLRHRKIDSLEKLKKCMDLDVKAYNTDRPHWSLPQQMAPACFEEYIKGLPKGKRPKMIMYKENKKNLENEFFLAMKQSDKENSSH